MAEHEGEAVFGDVVQGLLAGDFSRLEPLFEDGADGEGPAIIRWYESGAFDGEAPAAAEALTCACFNGRTKIAEYLLDRGVDVASGFGTGMSGFHWAANRGQLETVRMLIARGRRWRRRTCTAGRCWGARCGRRCTSRAGSN